MAVSALPKELADVVEQINLDGIALRVEGPELRAKPRPSEEMVAVIREHRAELYLWTLGRAVQAGTQPLAAFTAALAAYEQKDVAK